ncbi:type III secretion system protein SctP [Xanthomonas translucens pv. undulosa]|uniref:type III secretion system protein SctP n=2 Tax=Xanthomonas campestris pv. translucens TaxID=343 RepID=UPI00147E6DCE|nr:type III secretion system protein SctP [Xanthomonas translucens pv. translucens]QSQ47649.1 type III secretion system protein SctP [Xanthomonas translucens pv. undulosa]QSQ53356.1 type III secretion system protein SctP [Xanthomonas translucens pv. undulosa]QSQ61028.1 type III secretion system protein SctP [Xanthomonas translucens pv. undulosa]UKE42598.1 type III secretion system protein SctP [Xanthomonas translucens pv. secalis]
MRRPLRPTIIGSAPLAAPGGKCAPPSAARMRWSLYGTRSRSTCRNEKEDRECEDENAPAILSMLAPEPDMAEERVQTDAPEQASPDAAAPDHHDLAQPVLPPPTAPANIERRIANAVLHDSHARLAMQRVANHVSEFCNAAPVREGGLWEAQLDLREDVLPATNLWMRLSPGSLLLRFRCGTPLAQQLVCTGRQSLHKALDAVLDEPCDVDIEVV